MHRQQTTCNTCDITWQCKFPKGPTCTYAFQEMVNFTCEYEWFELLILEGKHIQFIYNNIHFSAYTYNSFSILLNNKFLYDNVGRSWDKQGVHWQYQNKMAFQLREVGWWIPETIYMYKFIKTCLSAAAVLLSLTVVTDKKRAFNMQISPCHQRFQYNTST